MSQRAVYGAHVAQKRVEGGEIDLALTVTRGFLGVGVNLDEERVAPSLKNRISLSSTSALSVYRSMFSW